MESINVLKNLALNEVFFLKIVNRNSKGDVSLEVVLDSLPRGWRCEKNFSVVELLSFEGGTDLLFGDYKISYIGSLMNFSVLGNEPFVKRINKFEAHYSVGPI